MAKWTAFAHADKAYAYTAATLKKNWDRLHRGDCEPFPKNAKVQDAWIAAYTLVAGVMKDAARAEMKVTA